MKEAIITATFKMRNAWNEADSVDTGLLPREGVRNFLIDEGLDEALEALAGRFGMKLCDHWTFELNEQDLEVSNE